jgi:hypothetical protein
MRLKNTSILMHTAIKILKNLFGDTVQRGYSMQPINMPLNQYDIFLVVTPCSFVDRYQRFGATFCLRIQGKMVLLKLVVAVSYETCAFTKPRGFTFHSSN